MQPITLDEANEEINGQVKPLQKYHCWLYCIEYVAGNRNLAIYLRSHQPNHTYIILLLQQSPLLRQYMPDNVIYIKMVDGKSQMGLRAERLLQINTCYWSNYLTKLNYLIYTTTNITKLFECQFGKATQL